jgi:hypothetical protein
MDSETLRQLISSEEGAKLDFKVKFYEIFNKKPSVESERRAWEDVKNQQWGECVKDVLALANGNVGTVHQTAYLVIGAADKLNPDGTRNLLDVGKQLPARNNILEKVYSYCYRWSLDIQCEEVVLDGKKLFVISILPSLYLYRLAKDLVTSSGKVYTNQTVLIRSFTGDTYSAKPDEIKSIEQDKELTRLNNRVLSAEQGNATNRQPLSLEVYERKIAIYRTTRDFIGLIISNADITAEAILKFVNDKDEALFLFDREVADYLQELQRKAAKLYAINQPLKLDHSKLPIGETRWQLADESSELLLWFELQFEVMREIFYKHIAL